MEFASLIKNLEENLKQAKNERQLIEFKNIFIKQHLLPLYDELKVSQNKKELGLKINKFKNAIEDVSNKAIESINDLLDTPELSKWTNKSVNINYLKQANAHILNKIVDDIANFFKQLNFEIVNGSEVVLSEMNFNNLNIDENHPARASADSFFVDVETMLRTHCTTTTAERLNNNKNKDIRIMSYGNVYRKDDDDATHSHQFMQIDFVWVKEGLTIANLKWLINALIKYLFGKNLKTRYRLSFFPFTEPSFEVDVQCFKCNGEGCSICKKTTWIEILGTGMLNQNVLAKANLSHLKTGLAFGIGVDRVAMLKYGVDDIRYLYSNNIKFNKQIK